VAVSNHGPRLPESARPFEARWRGSASLGSGMGLYIVDSIVQGWGGQTWYTGNGTLNTFGFTVPASIRYSNVTRESHARST
jgi:signal transduction histidine kinase